MPASVVYRGRVFSVEVEDVVLPNGHATEMAFVRHRPSVVLIPVRDDGQIVMIRQYRHALRRDLWELPAGNVDAGELPEAAAARECEEEIGQVPARVERLGAFYPTPGYCDEEMSFYRADGLRQPHADETARPDDDEDIEARHFSRAALRQMIATGEIIDLKTVAGLALLER